MAAKLKSHDFECDIEAPGSQILTGESAKYLFQRFAASPKPRKPESSRLSRKFRPPPKRSPPPPPKKRKIGISFLDSGDEESVKVLKREDVKPVVEVERSPSLVLVSK